MKAIPLKDFDPGAGQEYQAALYPSTGLFRNPRTSTFIMVYSINGVRCAVSLGSGNVDVGAVDEQAAAAAGGITADLLLRAIAITRTPDQAQAYLSRP